MATDFAALGISVDTGDLKRAKKELEALGKESKKTEKEVQDLGKESKKTGKDVDNLGTEFKKTKKDTDDLGKSIDKTGKETDDLGKSFKKTGKESNNLKNLFKKTGNSAKQLGNETEKLKNKNKSLGQSYSSLKSTLATLGLVALTRKVVSSTSTLQDLDVRLKSLTKVSGDYAQTQSFLSKISDTQHKSIVTLSDSYARLRVLQNSGIITGVQTQDILIGLNDAASALGASNAQLGQVFFGLAQGLSSSKLKAEELNQVMDPLPGLLQSMDKASKGATKGADGTAGSFRRLVLAGKVTSELFATTLIKALKDFEGQSALTAGNVSAKMTDIENSWFRLVTTLEEEGTTKGVFNLILEGANAALKTIEFISGGLIRTLKVLAVTAATVGTAFGIYQIALNASIIKTTAMTLATRGLTAVLAINPLTGLITSLGVLIGLLVTANDEIEGFTSKSLGFKITDTEQRIKAQKSRIETAEGSVGFLISEDQLRKEKTALLLLNAELNSYQKELKKVQSAAKGAKPAVNGVTKELTDQEKSFNKVISSLEDEQARLRMTAREYEITTLAAKGFTGQQIQAAIKIWDFNKALKDQQVQAKKDKVDLINLEKAQSDYNRALEDLNSFGDFDDLFPSISKESLDILEKYSKKLPKTIQGVESLTAAVKEQKAVMEEWSGLLSGTFSQLLSDGDSFTQNLADMFDNMIDRMLASALKFASDNIIQGLFAKGGINWGQSLFGAAVGAAAIGVSYLLSDDNAPRRGDIAPSRTTTSGDNRAVGFADMVAADIASRDYIYALQLEEFRIMNQNLKSQVNLLSSISLGSTLSSFKSIPADLITSIDIRKQGDSALSYVSDKLATVLPKDVTANFSDVADNAGDLISVISAAYNIYSTISNWDDFSARNAVASITTTAASLATLLTGATSAAAGIIATGLTNAYIGVENIIKGDILEGISSLISVFTSGIGGSIGSLVAGVLGLEYSATTGILGGLFSGDKEPPKISLGSATRKAARGTVYHDIKKRRPGRSPVQIPNGGKGLVGTSEFGITRINLQHADLTPSLVKSMRKIIKLIQRTDHIIAEGIKSVDETTGENTLKKFNKKRSGFERRGELEKIDFADAINSRMKWLAKKLGKTRTLAGKAFRAWFHLFRNKFGAEHSVGIAQSIGKNLKGLATLPLQLVKLMRKNIKSFKLGGTPKAAVKEMTSIVTSYTLLKAGLDSLGGSDVSGDKIASFLGKMNRVGFAVDEAGASLLQYAQVLSTNNKDISEGIDELFEFADNRKFKSRDYSNFFSVIGSFSSLGQSLGVATESMTDFMGIADIVGDIAESTLDADEFNALKEQAKKYGGLTVARARKEIEELGLATGDSILQVVNNVMFLNNALEITGNTFASMGKTLLETVVFSQELVEVMGGLDEAENKWSAFIKAMYSDIEIANINYKQAANSANSLLTSIGLGGLAFNKFREVFDESLPELTPAQVNSWINTGIAIGAANEALEQLTSGLVTDLQAIWNIGDASNERYERELDYIKQINEYVDSLLVNEALSPLSNAQRLAEAKSQFSVQLSLAKVGDEDALQGITGFANEYLTEARSFFASGADYTSIFDQVTSSLLGIEPTTAAEFDFNDIPDSILEQTTALLQASEVSMEGIIAAINKAFGADFATTNEGIKSVLSGVSDARELANPTTTLQPPIVEPTATTDKEFINSLYYEAYNTAPPEGELDYWMRVSAFGPLDRERIIGEFERFGNLSDGVDLSNVPLFADGGIATSPSIFGDNGAEAAVPLPNGRSIPVELKGSQIDTDAIVNAIDASAEDNAQRLFIIQQELQESRRENAKLNRRLSKLEVMA